MSHRKKVIKIFDVNLITIDDQTVSIKNVKNMSLTSARLILVNDKDEQKMINPGIIDCLSMFNVTRYIDEIEKGVE